MKKVVALIVALVSALAISVVAFAADPSYDNINVNSNSGSAPSGTAEAVDLSNYFSTLPEQSETMNDYLKNFFSFLPPQLLAVLLGGIGCAVLCRVLGR